MNCHRFSFYIHNVQAIKILAEMGELMTDIIST